MNKMRSASWKTWCRLCAAQELAMENRTDQQEEKQLAEMLNRFFGIEMKQPPKSCCRNCLHRLQDLHTFSQHVDRVQGMFEELCALEETNNSDLNWSIVAKRFDFVVCGFDDDASNLNNSNIEKEQPVKIETSINAETSVKSESGIESKTSREHDVLSFSDDDAETKSHKKSLTEAEQVDTVPPKKLFSRRRGKKSSGRHLGQHVCTQCQQSYTYFAQYRRHMRLQHKQEIPLCYQCTQCSCSFTTALKLLAHSKTHLPLELKKTFDCSYCMKKFTTPYVMQKHISAVHNNEKPYICEECGAAIKSGSSLKAHMLTHTEDRPLKCNDCYKTFKQYRGLKRHMELHSKQKFTCSVCGFKASTNASLKRHMVVHSDVKLYKCEFCEQQFKRAQGYKHHLLLHTGLKPYLCNFCDRTFAHGSNCRSHLKKMHPRELAELDNEKSESVKAAFTNNAPKMEQLKAMTKLANNIYQVHSKQKGK